MAFGVVRRIEQISQVIFHVTPGSLFPALHRMEASCSRISHALKAT
jgi:DNA-binding PadR family transcriptional regulator